ncbi:stage II sporulation protein M [Methanothermococcus sp.]|uniref:stage II sporulation protein M n=1 Tax=Methanothermococcus sp. TaxID=2614238 RepID=UPI0025FD5215|nr:stage II sporulation protein M [Methanothermococcus sp.]
MSKITYELLEIVYAFRRQKNTIYIITVLFLISFITSYILFYLDIGGVNKIGQVIFHRFSEYVNSLNLRNKSSYDIFLFILTHNLTVGLLEYITTIFSLFIVVSNAFILAYVLYISNNPLTFILLVLPHGIVEIPAFILSSVSGVVLFNAIVKKLKKSKDSIVYYKDSIRILLVSILLFIIAAIIESTITFEIKKLIIG